MTPLQQRLTCYDEIKQILQDKVVQPMTHDVLCVCTSHLSVPAEIASMHADGHTYRIDGGDVDIHSNSVEWR